MKEHLKRLTSESAYYGISTVGARLLGFLLVPFYTNVLPPSEYGIVITLYSYLAFLNVAFTWGMEPAFMRYFTDADERGKKELFSAALWFIAVVSIACTVFIHIFTTPVATAASIPIRWEHILLYGAWTIVLDACNSIPFALLRMTNKPKVFAAIRFGSILLNIALNVYLIVYLGMGIDAVFIAGLLASGLSTLFLLPYTIRQVRFTFPATTVKKLLAYGVPAVPALLASVTVSAIDKPILNYLMSPEVVGVYQANYKLGIFMMLIVSMFQFAWQPFFLQMKSQPNAKEMFARVMTYFSLIAVFVFLVLSFMIDDIVHISIMGRYIIHPDYWGGLGIVPVILLSYVFTGLYYISNAGLFIENRTKYLGIIAGAGAVVNIGANFLLIPIAGMYGAAVATLAAYVTMAGLSYIITQRIYPVRYEFMRLGKIALAAALCFAAWEYGNIGDYIPELLSEVALVAGYIALLWVFRFFSRGELQEIRNLARKITGGVSRRGNQIDN